MGEGRSEQATFPVPGVAIGSARLGEGGPFMLPIKKLPWDRPRDRGGRGGR